MRIQSINEVLDSHYAPIRLAQEFPVSEPVFNVRSSEPEIKPHIHDCLEIGYCYDGSGVFLIGEKMLSYKKGDAVLINNREVHITAATPGETTRWGFLNFDQIALLSAFVGPEEPFLEADSLGGRDFENIIDNDKHPEMAITVKRIIEESAERASGYKSMVRSQVWSLMIWLHRVNVNKKPTSVIPDLHENLKRITPALKYIADHYSGEISMQTLASLCRASVSNLRKLFSKAVGCAPQVYIKRLRMKAAAVLLRNSGRTILDISMASGYASLSNFNRQFHEYYGVCPKAWRKKY